MQRGGGARQKLNAEGGREAKKFKNHCLTIIHIFDQNLNIDNSVCLVFV